MMEIGILTDGAFMNDGVYKSGSGGVDSGLTPPTQQKAIVKVELYYESESKKPIIKVSKPTS